jgi:hypothetical protein
MMQKFPFVALLNILAALGVEQEKLAASPALDEISDDDDYRIRTLMVRAGTECRRLGMAGGADEPIARISNVLVRINGHARDVDGRSPSGVRHDLKALRESLNHSLSKYLFLYMPQEAARFYDQPELFSNRVAIDFPRVNEEITLAGNCYAAGVYTACVFHLTRALERALFVLAQDPTLGITIRNAREETWETLINKIESWLTALQKAPNTTPNKKPNLENYSGPALQFRYFKDHWRNPISHGRASYDGPQALSALGKVRDLMESFTKIPGLKEDPAMIMP